jgi:hypothetical protein
MRGRVAGEHLSGLTRRDVDDEHSRAAIGVFAARENARAIRRPMLPAVDP